MTIAIIYSHTNTLSARTVWKGGEH